MQRARKIILSAILIVSAFSAFNFKVTPTDAVDYVPLERIPGIVYSVEAKEGKNYVSTMYTLLIGLAGVLAVGMIVYGGIEYMVSDIANTKSAAKAKIWGAIWGLVLIAGSFIILQTINPNLVNFNLDIASLTRQLRGNTTPTTSSNPTPTPNPTSDQTQ